MSSDYTQCDSCTNNKTASDPNNHSLFDLTILLRRVGKDQAKLSKKELKRRSAFGKKEDGKEFCFFESIKDLMHSKPKNN